MLLLCDVFAGWMSGMVAVAVGHPFDTLKVRQQVRNISALRAARVLIKDAGFFGFYRGMSFPFTANGILNSAFFGMYGPLTDVFSYSRTAAAQANEFSSGLLEAEVESYESTYTGIFLAGAVSGFLQSFLATPIDLVKIKLQAATKGEKNYYKGSIDAIRGIHRTSGFKGFFQGFWIMTMREIPGFSCWITTYEILRQEIPFPEICSENVKNLISGGLAGTSVWALIMPIDTLKSKLQADNQDKPKFKGIGHCASELWKEKGVKGFYRGFLSASIRAFPVNAASLLTYQLIVGECRTIKKLTGSKSD